MIDNNEADDKIICILKGDDVYESWKDISEVPEGLINRLKHYFLTYKNLPGDIQKRVEIESVYGAVEAKQIIEKSRIDYATKFDQH
jgi:inorganic pyrophosphatase